jgi:hypothetical protein
VTKGKLMPTPIHVFTEIAATYGNVNPDDSDAVQKWYIETLPTLKPELIDEIIEALIRHDGTKPIPSTEKSYPIDVPLPSLKDSIPAKSSILRTVFDLYLKRIWKRIILKK